MLAKSLLDMWLRQRQAKRAGRPWPPVEWGPPLPDPPKAPKVAKPKPARMRPPAMIRTYRDVAEADLDLVVPLLAPLGLSRGELTEPVNRLFILQEQVHRRRRPRQTADTRELPCDPPAEAGTRRQAPPRLRSRRPSGCPSGGARAGAVAAWPRRGDSAALRGEASSRRGEAAEQQAPPGLERDAVLASFSAALVEGRFKHEVLVDQATTWATPSVLRMALPRTGLVPGLGHSASGSTGPRARRKRQPQGQDDHDDAPLTK